MTLIDRLKDLMRKSNMKVPAISNATGIDGSKIHKWLQGKANPKHADSLILEDFLKKEEVPRGTFQNPPVDANKPIVGNLSAHGNGSSFSTATLQGKDYRLLYEELLEDIVKGKGGSWKELESRLNAIEQNQITILSIMHTFPLEQFQALIQKAGIAEIEIQRAYKDNTSKKDKPHR
jgi:transcriptional regulator with XRE-family HTH domain